MAYPYGNRAPYLSYGPVASGSGQTADDQQTFEEHWSTVPQPIAQPVCPSVPRALVRILNHCGLGSTESLCSFRSCRCASLVAQCTLEDTEPIDPALWAFRAICRVNHATAPAPAYVQACCYLSSLRRCYDDPATSCAAAGCSSGYTIWT